MPKKIIYNDDVERAEKMKEQMRINSEDWFNADPERQKGLHRNNEFLAAEIDKITGGKSTFDPNTGKWSTAFSDSGGNWSADGAPTQKTYTPINQDKIDALQSEITNSKFSYSPSNDPSYKAYENAYRREGDRAVKSTLADVATAQGGVSSYAGSAAQQEANYYAQQLTDKIPALEALAYEKYSADLNNKYNMLNYLENQQNNDYNRFINDRNYELAQDQYRWQQDTYNREFEYGQQRDKIADEQFNRQQSFNEYAASVDMNRRSQQDAYSSALDFMTNGIKLNPEWLQRADIPQDVADAFYNMYWNEYLKQNGGYYNPTLAQMAASYVSTGTSNGQNTPAPTVMGQMYSPAPGETSYLPSANYNPITGQTANATTPSSVQSTNYSAAADTTDEDLKKNSSDGVTDTENIVVPGTVLTDNGSVLTDREWELLDKYHFDENLMLRDSIIPTDFNLQEFEEARSAQMKYNQYMDSLDRYIKSMEQQKAKEQLQEEQSASVGGIRPLSNPNIFYKAIDTTPDPAAVYIPPAGGVTPLQSGFKGLITPEYQAYLDQQAAKTTYSSGGSKKSGGSGKKRSSGGSGGSGDPNDTEKKNTAQPGTNEWYEERMGDYLNSYLEGNMTKEELERRYANMEVLLKRER